MTLTRRRLLTGFAAGAAATVGAETAAADDSGVAPSDVHIEFPRSELETYQPLLVVDQDDREQLTGLYGYRARSPAYEHDWYCYWARYAVQRGTDPWTSHLYDHEPVYCAVAPDTGDVRRVIFSGYHHYAAEVAEPALTQDRASEPTHVSLRVVPTYHHYQYREGDVGGFETLRDWPAVRTDWQEYGFYEATHDPAVDDPQTMLDRDSWWADDTLDARVGQLWAAIGLRTGLYGGDAAAETLR